MNKKELIIGFFEKGYCCDLDEVKDTCLGLLKENQELKLELSGYRHAILNNKEMLGLKEQNDKLKKQLEEINKKIEKCGFVNIEQVMLNYCGLLTQQQEFIKYLEDEIFKNTPTARWIHYDEDGSCDYTIENCNCVRIQPVNETLKEILQKYKEKIGGKDE